MTSGALWGAARRWRSIQALGKLYVEFCSAFMWSSIGIRRWFADYHLCPIMLLIRHMYKGAAAYADEQLDEHVNAE